VEFSGQSHTCGVNSALYVLNCILRKRSDPKGTQRAFEYGRVDVLECGGGDAGGLALAMVRRVRHCDREEGLTRDLRRLTVAPGQLTHGGSQLDVGDVLCHLLELPR